MSTMFDQYAEQLKNDLNYFYNLINFKQTKSQHQSYQHEDFKHSVDAFIEIMRETGNLNEFRLLAKMIHDQKEYLERTVNGGVEFDNLSIELASENTYANKWFEPTDVWDEILKWSLAIGFTPILAAPALIILVVVYPPVILFWAALLVVSAVSLAVFFTTLAAYAAYATIGLIHDNYFHINENNFNTMKSSLQGVNSFFKPKPALNGDEVPALNAANETNLTKQASSYN